MKLKPWPVMVTESIKCMKGSTNYTFDKKEFDVSSEGPWSGIPDEGRPLETSNLFYRLGIVSRFFDTFAVRVKH